MTEMLLTQYVMFEKNTYIT